MNDETKISMMDIMLSILGKTPKGVSAATVRCILEDQGMSSKDAGLLICNALDRGLVRLNDSLKLELCNTRILEKDRPTNPNFPFGGGETL
jgi:hypothetical protein